LFFIFDCQRNGFVYQQNSFEEKKSLPKFVFIIWFTNDDYATKGNLIKWNSAVKQLMIEKCFGALLDELM
jgi:hypothetical protein